MDASPAHSDASRTWFGSLALFAGVALLILCGIEAMSQTGLTAMPRAWRANQGLWWVFGVVSVVAGCNFLAPRIESGETSWRPSLTGIRFREVLLYTREGCHLCDEAALILEQHRRWLPRVVSIDIDHDPRLVEKYGTCVPVVVCDGKVRFRSRVPVALLRRMIEGTPPM